MQSAQEYAEMMHRSSMGGNGGYGPHPGQHPGAHRMDSYPPPPGDYVMVSAAVRRRPIGSCPCLDEALQSRDRDRRSAETFIPRS